MKNNVRILSLEHVRSPYTGEHYIGFVLDVINEYLGWGVKEYHLDGGTLSKRRVGEMSNDSGENIRVNRIPNQEGIYAVGGWPCDNEWDVFQREAQRVLEKILRN